MFAQLLHMSPEILAQTVLLLTDPDFIVSRRTSTRGQVQPVERQEISRLLWRAFMQGLSLSTPVLAPILSTPCILSFQLAASTYSTLATQFKVCRGPLPSFWEEISILDEAQRRTQSVAPL